MASDKPIIIIGAGLVGLTLAQGLKKAGFSYRIYDRDGSLHDRPAGWGISVHWALPALMTCLPPELYSKIPSIQVDPDLSAKGLFDFSTPLQFGDMPDLNVSDRDYFRFLDLETGTDRYNVPAAKYYRLNRKKLRELLSTGIDVTWGKQYTSFEANRDSVTVHFADGSQVEGSLLLGVDGKSSRIKRMLLGDEKANLHPLPIGFMGLTLHLSPEKMKPFRNIHPVFWQGTHPTSGYYVFFSMLSTPNSNGSLGTADEYCEAQLNLSWHIKQNGETPKGSEALMAKLKGAAVAGTGFFPSLRDAVLAIPDDSSVKDLKLEDWPTQEWQSVNGRVTLLGDAAHTMTMCKSLICSATLNSTG